MHVGAEKMGLEDVEKVVLEKDGTEIDEDCFQYLNDGTTLILLHSSEQWNKPELGKFLILLLGAISLISIALNQNTFSQNAWFISV